MAKRKQTILNETVFEPKIIESSLEDIVSDRFSRYSKYIIQERALPDARDGLKPVQRRILWAMEEDGNTSNHPYRKSARTVGNVIGNYHPHGDTSVYDAIVRLSQDWKSALPLIDMQGNNGSIDDDPPAAMRYTEARLSPISQYLLEDIDKDTVEWTPNFSDEKVEPTVLPVRYPNLLINGITGIAAGYATNIPPHNFNEVIQACIYRLDHPQCTLEELMQFVKGPDFPTGGIVLGQEGIYEALKSGKGRIAIRAKAELVLGKTINQIIITEIPYEVTKSSLVKRIDELRLSGKVNGILEVRDESDRKGLRLVCDLKKEANGQAILNYLYKNTDLQVYYHYNVIAIVNRTPRQLGLEEMLDAFLAHREEVVLARSQYDLKRRQDRLHLVEGLIRAVSILNEIVKTIRASKSKAESKTNIMEQFSFSEAQAEAIVTMQLYRLSTTDLAALQKEQTTLQKEIKQLESILKNPAKRIALMKKELQEVSDGFVMPRRSQIVEENAEVVVDDRDMIVEEQVMLSVSRQGYLKRVSKRSFATSQSSLGGLKEGDQFVFSAPVSTLDTLLFFTNKGRFGMVPVYQLEEKKWKDLGIHLSSFFKTDPGEQIVQVFVEKEPSVHTDLILASKLGQVRRFHREDLPAKMRGRLVALMNLGQEDSLEFVVASPSVQDKILFLSKRGFGFWMESEDIPLSKGKSKGVRAMNLESDDVLQAVMTSNQDLLEHGWIVLENQMGQFKKLAAASIDRLHRPAKGMRLFKEIKSRPLHLLSIAARASTDPIPFENPELPPLEIAALPKMEPYATWSSQGALAQATAFEVPSLRLTSGERTQLEEEDAWRKKQLCLSFDEKEDLNK
ncbi:MAG: DNA topoisomerase IV subunit A [Allobaculum sp.]|nr:DNA topoisomerase IV subunit A [Allobaculum sp.]